LYLGTGPHTPVDSSPASVESAKETNEKASQSVETEEKQMPQPMSFPADNNDFTVSSSESSALDLPPQYPTPPRMRLF
jgi:hypothetical protein